MTGARVITTAGIAAAALGAALLAGVGFPQAAGAAPVAASTVGPVNPVAQPLAGHPANSGFTVIAQGNVLLAADESEGTVAVGGNLSFTTSYNVAAHSPAVPTFTAPGDTVPTLLYVRGGVVFPPTAVNLKVLNGGYTKIGDTATYTAFDHDQNNALINYSIVPPGGTVNTNPQISGTVTQTPASIGTPVPSSLIDVDGAFALYRPTATALAGCDENVLLTDANGAPITRPITSPTSVYLTLTPGVTNVLNLTAAELGQINEITYRTAPTASTPLLINVSGDYSGTFPNQAGVSGGQAPYILWNFASASTVTVNGGAAMEGTLYAPNAAVSWVQTNNIEGNVVAASFVHGPGNLGQVREVHDFPFAAELSCQSAPLDDPILSLVKVVHNSDGSTGQPSDWTLTASGPDTVTGQGGSADVTQQVVAPGDYTLSESGTLPDYTAGDWSCVGGVVSGDVVTLPQGAEVTCTIENTYVPPPPTPTPTPTPPPVVPDNPDSAAGGPTGELADTGSGAPAPMVALGILLLSAGAVVTTLGLVRQRRNTRGE
ncbi:collagen-binding domain-containing protein [Leifsonia shinshuensis]|uniref:Choice-of-anchor A family protein n=1 Tax=Leifsonia shinshuensis TaxID=150026 RepID=A0A7G6YEL7_9MICO|nr:collagen-binding domain-containing protein [Leifsonia shinshuensis]QNE36932.1 choice-of-anchor A family protein [Leifsonia shinshuensis]